MNDSSILIESLKAQPHADWAALSCELPKASFICFQTDENIKLKSYLQMLARIESVNSGKISYLDNIKLGYLDETINLVSVLSGFNNLILAANYHQLNSPELILQQAEELLVDFNCLAIKDSLPAFMSAFEQRLLLILRALMLSPDILFIAKPFHGLDYCDYSRLHDCLVKLVTERNISLVCCDYEPEFIEKNTNMMIHYQQQTFKITS